MASLVNILLASGVNPNAKEGCGATPLTLAVIKTDIALCKILVENFAKYQGEMRCNYPSPLDMAYGWCTEVPGNMHAKGYLCEAGFKAHGSGGLHKILNTVMKRSKLTKEAFKKRKFQDQNLNRIKEGVHDASQSYGMAAVSASQHLLSFPTTNELKRSLQKYGNHNEVLLQKFKEWLKESAEKDQSHAYHQQLFTLFGPLLALFIVAGKYGDGNLREIVWVIFKKIT